MRQWRGLEVVNNEFYFGFGMLHGVNVSDCRGSLIPIRESVRNNRIAVRRQNSIVKIFTGLSPGIRASDLQQLQTYLEETLESPVDTHAARFVE